MINENLDSATVVFNFLYLKLTQRKNPFIKSGDHSLFYKDNRDIIFVYVNNNQVLLILDGLKAEVSSHFTVLPIYPGANEASDEVLDATYLQPILQLF
jgi:hypothetical protein